MGLQITWGSLSSTGTLENIFTSHPPQLKSTLHWLKWFLGKLYFILFYEFESSRPNHGLHPSLLIDVRLKGHLHRYKLHQIFQFFKGFLMVPLLKRKVWRFFRAGPNGPSPPTHFWQQNSAIPPPSSLQHDLL